MISTAPGATSRKRRSSTRIWSYHAWAGGEAARLQVRRAAEYEMWRRQMECAQSAADTAGPFSAFALLIAAVAVAIGCLQLALAQPSFSDPLMAAMYLVFIAFFVAVLLVTASPWLRKVGRRPQLRRTHLRSVSISWSAY